MTSALDSVFDMYKHKNCNQVFDTISDLNKELIKTRDDCKANTNPNLPAAVIKQNMIRLTKLDKQQTELERHVKYCQQLKKEKRNY
jgi:hypothetical protein